MDFHYRRLANVYVYRVICRQRNKSIYWNDEWCFLSPDNGSSWSEVNNGLTTLHVQSLAISGSNIFAGTYQGGVFRSTNNGSSWTSVSNGLPMYPSFYSLTISGSNILRRQRRGCIYQQIMEPHGQRLKMDLLILISIH